MVLQDPHRVCRLDVMAQHEDPDLRVAGPDRLGRLQPFVRVGRWHPDVDDGHVRAHHVDPPQQVIGGRGGRDDVDARLAQQTGETLPQEELVVRDHDAHGISAVRWSDPSRTSVASVPVDGADAVLELGHVGVMGAVEP